MSYGYWSDLETDGYEWTFRPNACSGIIPTSGGEACVFAAGSPGRIGTGGVALIHDVIAEGSPAVAERLRAATPRSSARTWTGQRGYIRQSWGPGWALVGDAGCFSDPIGLHGLTDAFRDAELLARVVADGLGGGGGRSTTRWPGTSRLVTVSARPLFEVVDRIVSHDWGDEEISRLLSKLTSALADEVEAITELETMTGLEHGGADMKPRTLLGVWAHPDDDAYLSAGLMAAWRQRGDRVVVVTATLGEHGTSDPQAWPPRRLGRHRRREMCASLATLGVHEVRLLGFEDGTCEHHDGTAAIADHIADLAPDRIVTFGPDGITNHPDHCAVSRWTTDAWSAIGPRCRALVRARRRRSSIEKFGAGERGDRPLERAAGAAVHARATSVSRSRSMASCSIARSLRSTLTRLRRSRSSA